MNIKIPYHWLLEYLETKATPAELAKYLSLCGPSVETFFGQTNTKSAKPRTPYYYQ